MPPTPPVGELRLVDDVPTAFAEVVVAEFTAARSAAAGGSGDGRFRMALSGGETARACYQQLAAEAGIDWAAVDVLLGDERCVPPDDPAANQRLVREALLAPTGDLARFRPMDCENPGAYEALLLSEPPLDLIHLGLGPDGHTASLFSGSAALTAPEDSLVVLSEDPSGLNPHPRLTFTFSAIARGRLVVFTVAGSGKHAALRRLLDGEDLPAARVRAGRVLWLCDQAALQG
ncbi:MAG TPA: 6-phosphogluconolactonase [Acidimicrobiales bacterium]|nr:6-phosphogluconolactonase [Acidimicrobiales bacterium]